VLEVLFCKLTELPASPVTECSERVSHFHGGLSIESWWIMGKELKPRMRFIKSPELDKHSRSQLSRNPNVTLRSRRLAQLG